jgi:ATP-dependent RNA helicase DeaD
MTMHRHPSLPKAFADLGIQVQVLRALAEIGYAEPSPIQAALIPIILSGKDVLGQAQTGTGKTAAFGMPMLQMIDQAGPLQAVILTPTRELAAQVVGEFRRIAQFLDLHIVPIYGGVAMKHQLHLLGRRPHVVVGTPGRVLDLLGRGVLSFNQVRFVILDEVDRMLDIGFRDDIKRILGRIEHQHQTTFVSATLDEPIKKLAYQYMRDPVEVNVSRDELTVGEVDQFYCTVDPWDKYRLLRRVLAIETPKLAIIFTNTKHGARKLAKRLHADGIPAKEIHGDLVQEKREKIMERFRKHQIPVLVATDLAARGIDVNQISHIINYDLPQDIEIYVHRVGRTARMGETGKAITFVIPDQGPELDKIEIMINKQLKKLEVEGFTGSPPPRGEQIGEVIPDSVATAVVTAPVKPAAPARAGVGSQGRVPLSRRRRR